MKTVGNSGVTVPKDIVDQLKNLTQKQDGGKFAGPQIPGPSPTPQRTPSPTPQKIKMGED